MALAPGTQLGRYEITALLGQGGMGEVYRAHDSQVKRDVAIKVSAAEFPERFQREAEAVAALNHSNICTLFDVGPNFLVMELVEGDTLAERIGHGPMPEEEAFGIARQIAAALEHAHARPIVHRDLKPANIKLRPDGVVKVLDFGLAKVGRTSRSAGAPGDNSPTLSLTMTEAGMILGTAAYMAPEQAKALEVDKRADIWAFGVVLYEMLTGKRMFSGDTVSDILAQVILKEPDLSALSPRAQRLLGWCLEKDRTKRLRDIGDAVRLMDEAPGVEVAAPPAARSSRLWPALAGVAAIAAGVSGYFAWATPKVTPEVTQFQLAAPPNVPFNNGWPNLAVSPDGRKIVFRAGTSLWLRELGSATPRLLPGTEGGNSPFWAPDSRRLAFYAGKLKKIDIAGGPPLTLADAAGNLTRGSWSGDDVILFGLGRDVVWRVAAGGGTPQMATELKKSRDEQMHAQPWFLPDGRHFLYLAFSADPEKSATFVGSLDSKDRTLVMAGDTPVTYSAGYLLFIRDRILMAQPFDTTKLAVMGDARPVAEGLATARYAAGFQAGQVGASQNGVLAYQPGEGGGNVQLTWFDRAGKKLDAVGAVGDIEGYSLSPDGTAVVFARRDARSGLQDLWRQDFARGSETRLTFAGENNYPVWSHDGARVIFATRAVARESGTIAQVAANGSGQPEALSAEPRLPYDASRDGRYLFSITNAGNPKTANDLWVLPLFGDKKAFAYLETEFQEARPRLSPDGRWLAYRSNESKRQEVYVMSFPNKGGKWQVSANGGSTPFWSHDGRELYFYSADQKLMAAPIQPGATFQAGVPKELFPVRLQTANVTYQVHKDGRFLLPVIQEGDASDPLTVVLNWPQLLK